MDRVIPLAQKLLLLLENDRVVSILHLIFWFAGLQRFILNI